MSEKFTQSGQHSVNRRSVLRISAAALVALALPSAFLTACSSASSSESVSADSTPHSGGTLSYVSGTNPDSWDPHATSTNVTGLLLRPIFDSLVSQNEDGSFSPWLATSWSTSPDQLTYTFELRDDVTFSDGTRFDAAAVKANFDHIVAPETLSKRASSLLGPYVSTDVLSDFTVAVKLSRPYSSFLNSASTTFLGFHSPKSLLEHGGDLAAGGSSTVSTGPFVFTSNIQGQKAVFDKRPDYAWAPQNRNHSGAAYLDHIEITILNESSSRAGAIGSGQVDIADQIPADKVDTLSKQDSIKVAQNETPGAPYSFYLNTERAPFDNVDARRAVQYAIDPGAITEGVFRGNYDRAWSPLTPATLTYDTSLAGTWKPNQDKANELLDQLGYTTRDSAGYRTKDGERLSVEMPYVQTFVSADNLTINSAVQDQLKQVGIELVLLPMDSASSIGRTREGNYDVFSFASGNADPAVLRNLYYSGNQFVDGGANAGRVHDESIDKWLDEAQATQDRARIEELYHQVQQRVINQAYAIPIYVSTVTTAAQSHVEDLEFDVQVWPNFYDIWLNE